MMLEHGWIDAHQLRYALNCQKEAGHGKLGQWLTQSGVSEQQVTRALSMQWSCPVLPLEHHDAQALSPVLPRLFVDAFGVLPLRVAAGRVLYLGFVDRVDPVVALAIDRMLGLRVEAGLVRESLFRSAHQRMLKASYPPAELVETTSESPLVRVLSDAVERIRPIDSRLVRVHDCLWLRLWLRPQTGPVPEREMVRDVICSLELEHGIRSD
jgi:hypothetical protein